MTHSIRDLVQYAWQLLNGFRAQHELWLSGLRKRDIEGLSDTKAWARVLDLANGRLRPQYAILKAAGCNVVGVDLVNRPAAPPIDFATRWARNVFLRRLGSSKGRDSESMLVCGDALSLPFADGSFSLVTSVAAFEHFHDVPGVLSELHRVLNPGGLVWACIHLFTSPSGGHNVNLSQVPLKTLPRNVDPWDHLRHRRLAFRVDLNEWRLHQYFEAFTRQFEILRHYCAMKEGEDFLTPESEAELSGYTREELTCGAYVMVARRS